MITMFKKLWHDPVWSKVIAGVILAVGATVVTYFLNWWPVISEFVSRCITFALASTSTPNWLLFVLVLLVLPVVFLFGVLIWEKIFLSQSSPPSWRTYELIRSLVCAGAGHSATEEKFTTHTRFAQTVTFRFFGAMSARIALSITLRFIANAAAITFVNFKNHWPHSKARPCGSSNSKIRNGSWLTRSSA